MDEIEDDEEEPPVPENLGSLNASLESFSDFMRLDKDLIQVAAENSIAEQKSVQKDIDQAWSAEVERRCQALDRGEAKLISGDEVFEKIRKRFSK